MFMAIFCGQGGALEYNAHGRRDPFVPLTGIARKGPTGGIYSVDDVMLQGIVIGPDGAYNAIINGKVVKAGDTVGRLFVESVGSNVVVIKIGELTHKVKLYEK